MYCRPAKRLGRNQLRATARNVLVRSRWSRQSCCDNEFLRCCRARYCRHAWRSGFTLVELMVVIVLIGLLAGAVTLMTRSYLISGKQGAAKLEISRIVQALDTFYTVYDRYPTNDEGIAILAEPSEKFLDGLLADVPTDPWGHEYEYVNPGRDTPYEVISFGADGREGGTGADQDISSTRLGEEGDDA